MNVNKYFLLFFIGVFTHINGYAQYPVQQNLPSRDTIISNQMPLIEHQLYFFKDTCEANGTRVRLYENAIIITGNIQEQIGGLCGMVIWIRQRNRWVKISGEWETKI